MDRCHNCGQELIKIDNQGERLNGSLTGGQGEAQDQVAGSVRKTPDAPQGMATLFHYGPYAWVSTHGIPPGAEHFWTFGPWPWYADAVTITAHPLALAGADRRMTVTSISSRAAPNGERFIDCTVRNVGPDWVNYAVWIGGVAP